MELHPPPHPLTPLCYCVPAERALWLNGWWWCAAGLRAQVAGRSGGCGFELRAMPARGRVSPELVLAAEPRSVPDAAVAAAAAAAASSSSEAAAKEGNQPTRRAGRLRGSPSFTQAPDCLEDAHGVPGGQASTLELCVPSTASPDGIEVPSTASPDGIEPRRPGTPTAVFLPQTRMTGEAFLKGEPTPARAVLDWLPAGALMPGAGGQARDGSAPLPRHHRGLRQLSSVERAAGEATAGMITAVAYGPMNAACFVAPTTPGPSVVPVPVPVPPASGEGSHGPSSVPHAAGDGDGLGLFARDRIPAGHAIGEWGGVRIPMRSVAAAVEATAQGTLSGYCLLPGTRTIIDGAGRNYAPPLPPQTSNTVAPRTCRWPATYALPSANAFNATIVCRRVEDGGEVASEAGASTRMWLIAEEAIERGAEIRFDPLAAGWQQLRAARAGAATQPSVAKREEGAASWPAPDDSAWRRLRLCEGLMPPALGPDPLVTLEAACFGAPTRHHAASDEGSEDESDGFESGTEEHADGTCMEPRPLYA